MTYPATYCCPTALTRVGRRDYIQGIAIAEAMAQAAVDWIPHAAGPLVIRTVKFIHKTLCDGDIYMAGADMAVLPALPAVAMISVLGARQIAAAFVPDPERPVSRWIERDLLTIAPVSLCAPYQGICEVAWTDRVGFCKTLVEVNKKVIEETLGNAASSQVIEIVQADSLPIPIEIPSYSGTVRVVHLGLRILGNRTYVLSRLLWDTDRSATFTFSYFAGERP
jgi:hypothetical protein